MPRLCRRLPSQQLHRKLLLGFTCKVSHLTSYLAARVTGKWMLQQAATYSAKNCVSPFLLTLLDFSFPLALQNPNVFLHSTFFGFHYVLRGGKVWTLKMPSTEKWASALQTLKQFTHWRVLIPNSLSVVCLGQAPGGAKIGRGLQGRRKGPPSFLSDLTRLTAPERVMGKHRDTHGPHHRTWQTGQSQAEGW